MKQIYRRLLALRRFETTGDSTCFNVPQVETSSTVVNFTNFIDGVSNPRYKSQILHGTNAATAMSAERVTLNHYTSGYAFSARTNLNGRCALQELITGSDIFLPESPNNYSSTEATNAARRRASTSVRETVSKFRGGNFLAEVSDTIRMLRHPLSSFRKGLDTYYLDAKKRLRRERRLSTRNLADLWLNYSFGWSPLVSDIESAIENLAFLERPRSIGFSASGSEEMARSSNEQSFGLSTRFVYNVVNSGRVVVKFYGKVKIDPPDHGPLASWGLSTRDFVPAIWEAIPWSFAVDYFTNIGDIVDSYSSIPGRVDWVNKTTRRIATTEIQSCRYDTVAFFNTFLRVQSNASALPRSKTSRVRVDRAISSVSELLTSDFRIENPFSVRRLCNVLALFRLRVL